MIHDGLWDPYNDCHMGIAAEKCATNYNITREEQDRYCMDSYNRAKDASEKGLFKNEIEPVEVTVRGKTTVYSVDEEFSKINMDRVPTLKPAFQSGGSVTAANASSISDGKYIL